MRVTGDPSPVQGIWHSWEQQGSQCGRATLQPGQPGQNLQGYDETGPCVGLRHIKENILTAQWYVPPSDYFLP